MLVALPAVARKAAEPGSVAADPAAAAAELQTNLNFVWAVLAAVLVFFMQAFALV